MLEPPAPATEAATMLLLAEFLAAQSTPPTVAYATPLSTRIVLAAPVDALTLLTFRLMLTVPPRLRVIAPKAMAPAVSAMVEAPLLNVVPVIVVELIVPLLTVSVPPARTRAVEATGCAVLAANVSPPLLIVVE